MQQVKAVTNRHPKFLKEAYKLDGIVDLVNDERWISHGDRFIRFDGLSFVVCIKTDNPISVASSTTFAAQSTAPSAFKQERANETQDKRPGGCGP